MLRAMFLSVLNMSITASFVILAVLLVRAALKKAPKVFSYALWLVVLFRLICPVSFESAIALLPLNSKSIPWAIVQSTQPHIDTGLSMVDYMVNPMLPIPNDMGGSINPLQTLALVGGAIWVIGMMVMSIYSMMQLVRLKQKLIGSTPLRGNIYLSDHISSPFVMGLIKPKIYLPSSMAETEQTYIIAHEKYHIKRYDPMARIIGFVALTVHWFNPLVWLAFIVSGKDMEMSCDEAVMQKMDSDIRAEYAAALLRFATGRKLIAATSLAFGEGTTKGRVKNVMQYKKPMRWAVIIAALLCVAAVLCLVSNPIGTNIRNPYVQEYVVGAAGILGAVDTEKYTKISEDFAIGADKYGRAVFKDPHKALATFETLYADAIALIKSEHDLKPFSHKNYEMYKVYGWQTGENEGDMEMIARCLFVSRFLDIYENSFAKTVPNTSNVEPTSEADFLNHPDGVKFQAAAYRAAKAYLSGDTDALAQYVSEKCVVDATLDVFKDIDYMILKWSPEDIKADDNILAAYEFRLKGEDTVSYVSMEMIKVDGEWKINAIGLEK